MAFNVRVVGIGSNAIVNEHGELNCILQNKGTLHGQELIELVLLTVQDTL